MVSVLFIFVLFRYFATPITHLHSFKVPCQVPLWEGFVDFPLPNTGLCNAQEIPCCKINHSYTQRIPKAKKIFNMLNTIHDKQ